MRDILEITCQATIGKTNRSQDDDKTLTRRWCGSAGCGTALKGLVASDKAPDTGGTYKPRSEESMSSRCRKDRVDRGRNMREQMSVLHQKSGG